MEETGAPGENHWPVASHWQTLSHNVVSSIPRLSNYFSVLFLFPCSILRNDFLKSTSVTVEDFIRFKVCVNYHYNTHTDPITVLRCLFFLYCMWSCSRLITHLRTSLSVTKHVCVSSMWGCLKLSSPVYTSWVAQASKMYNWLNSSYSKFCLKSNLLGTSWWVQNSQVFSLYRLN